MASVPNPATSIPDDPHHRMISFLPVDHVDRTRLLAAVSAAGLEWRDARPHGNPSLTADDVIRAVRTARFTLHPSHTPVDHQAEAVASTVRALERPGHFMVRLPQGRRGNGKAREALFQPDFTLDPSERPGRQLAGWLARQTGQDGERVSAVFDRLMKPGHSDPPTQQADCFSSLLKDPDWRNPGGHHDAFICYRSDQRELVRGAVRELDAAGIHVWWDDLLDLANRWRAQIQHMRRGCRLAIIFDDGGDLGGTQAEEIDDILRQEMPYLWVTTSPDRTNAKRFQGHTPVELRPSNANEAPRFPDLVRCATDSALRNWTWSWKRRLPLPPHPPVS